MNRTELLGRFTKAHEAKINKNGKRYIINTIATNAKTKDGDSQFIPVIFWEKKAEIIEKYTAKGTQIYVDGYLQVKSEQLASGEWTAKVLVVVQNIELLGSKGDNASVPALNNYGYDLHATEVETDPKPLQNDSILWED